MKRIIIASLSILLLSCTGINKKYKDSDTLFQNLIISFYGNQDKPSYPSYYGGAYKKDDILYVLVTDNDKATRRDLEKRCKGTGFFIKQSQYNHPLVEMVRATLDSLVVDIYKLPHLRYFAHSFDVKTRKIVVLLNDTTRENIKHFRYDVMDSPFFEFNYTSPIVAE